MLLDNRIHLNMIYTYLEDSWPETVKTYLSNNLSDLTKFKKQSALGIAYNEIQSISHTYDKIVVTLTDILNGYSLHGYHCTRLTNEEIQKVLLEGMQPQNCDLLYERISVLENTGKISTKVSTRLKNENQANEPNRIGQIWFCFFAPHIATEHGINRLFKSWGGEALYNSHEGDPETGKKLNRIGIPCIIEAKVPIVGLTGYSLSICMIKQFCFNRGLDENPGEFEDYSNIPIVKDNILAIHRFPDPKFNELTKCNTWKTRLII